MQKRISMLSLSILFLFLCLIMSSCGSISVSSPSINHIPTITHTVNAASPTSSHVTPTSTNQNTQSHDSYAFVRNEQLWVSLHGATPIQATSFTYPGNGYANVFWNQPLWFGNGRYIAFEVKVIVGGIGIGPDGNGCSFLPNYGHMAALFVLDTSTMHVTPITIPGQQNPGGRQFDGAWEYMFAQDATNLLVWQGLTNNTQGGLYRYNFTTGNVSLVLPISSMPSVEHSGEALSSMRYSNGNFYYEVAKNVSNGTYGYVIYSHSIANPNAPSVEVMNISTSTVCKYMDPGWDISADGQHLVVQKVSKNAQRQNTSIIQSVFLQDGTTTSLFPQLDASVLTHDVTLSWAPDNQTLVMKSYSTMSGQGSFFSTTLLHQTEIQAYPYTNNVSTENIFWKFDSTAFEFYALQGGETVVNTNVSTFTIGVAQSSVLLSNATNFAWS